MRFFSSRLDTEALAKWFDIGVFSPLCTVWNAFVIQNESVKVVVVFRRLATVYCD